MRTKLTITIPVWLDMLFVWPVMVYRRRKYGYDFRRIYLGQGIFTIVEPEDYYRFNDFHWSAKIKGPSIYAVRFIGCKNGSKIISLHREIANPAGKLLVDHRNGNTLDNRRDNLRLATQAQNAHNSRKRNIACSSKFKGVSFHKSKYGGKHWQAYISIAGRRIHLGIYMTELEAAKAYDAAARKYHGEFARLNFPNLTAVLWTPNAEAAENAER
jgi:hypothetical protein